MGRLVKQNPYHTLHNPPFRMLDMGLEAWHSDAVVTTGIHRCRICWMMVGQELRIEVVAWWYLRYQDKSALGDLNTLLY